jgi:hypothetical protein
MHPWEHPYLQLEKNPISQSAETKPQSGQYEQICLCHDKIGVMNIDVEVRSAQEKFKNTRKCKEAKCQ